MDLELHPRLSCHQHENRPENTPSGDLGSQTSQSTCGQCLPQLDLECSPGGFRAESKVFVLKARPSWVKLKRHEWKPPRSFTVRGLFNQTNKQTKQNTHDNKGLCGERSSLLCLEPELMRICYKGSKLCNVEFDLYDALTAGCIGIVLESRGQHDLLLPGDNGSALGTPIVCSAGLGSGS